MPSAPGFAGLPSDDRLRPPAHGHKAWPEKRLRPIEPPSNQTSPHPPRSIAQRCVTKPHPEEHRAAMIIEGWRHGADSRPSFETAAPRARPPQDEAGSSYRRTANTMRATPPTPTRKQKTSSAWTPGSLPMLPKSLSIATEKTSEQSPGNSRRCRSVLQRGDPWVAAGIGATRFRRLMIVHGISLAAGRSHDQGDPADAYQETENQERRK